MGKRSGIMLAYPMDEKRLQKWNTPGILLQPKLDGERCRVLYDGREATLVSSEENEIISVPHINEQLKRSFDHPIELDGELYIHGIDFSEIHSIVSRKMNIHDYSDKIELHIFDMVSGHKQIDRLQHLAILLPDLPSVKMVPTKAVFPEISEIMEAMQQLISEGYEGIILRHPEGLYERKRSTNIMKFKPKKNDIYQIIGFQEEISKDGTPKNTLGAFICIGEDDSPFGVGTGFTATQRKTYWEQRQQLLGHYVEVAYQSISPKGRVPRFPVFCRIVEALA